MPHLNARTTLRYGLLLLALTSVASASSISFVGAPTGVNDGSVYVLPYQITIDGTAQNVTCYDYLDQVMPGDTWQANVLDLLDAAHSGFFVNGTLADYEEIAWLSAQTYSDASQQIGLQYAIWNVLTSAPQSPDAILYERAAAAAAASGYPGFDFSNFRFIQEVGAMAGAAGTEQAFVFQMPVSAAPGLGFPVGTPEPGTVTTLAAGLLLLAAWKWKANRRSRPCAAQCRAAVR